MRKDPLQARKYQLQANRAFKNESDRKADLNATAKTVHALQHEMLQSRSTLKSVKHRLRTLERLMRGLNM